MKSRLLIWVFSTAAASAGESMNVDVCNVGNLPVQLIEHAESEAAYVFQSIGVHIHWTNCGGEVDAADPRMRPDYIVRVLVGGHISKVGPTSLEAMGRAFMEADGSGYLADTYYGAIHELTALHQKADSDQVLGCVMAHELGHLLIGPGHRLNGIMGTGWSRKELDALDQRHLKFNQAERAAILSKLRSRAAGSKTARP